MMGNYRKVIISDRYCLIGVPDENEIQKRSIFGLEVGARIIEIGTTNSKGNVTSQNRTDSFIEGWYAEYLGIIMIEGTEFMALALHPSIDKENIQTILLYTFEEELNEIYSALVGYQGVRIYQAKFKLLTNE